jgi:alginate O-acetyltransferase complex protein AlgI
VLFQSLDYAVFLTLAVTLFWVLRRQRFARMAMLFVLSAVFYMAWHPAYIFLILSSSLVDWYASIHMERSSDERVRKTWLVLSVGSNLALLGLFKYFDFGAGALEDALGLLGLEMDTPRLGWLLPIGISFYTFEAISYAVDVYRRHVKPAKNLLEFWVFITYFPRLVAGPIIRPYQFLPQLEAEPSLKREQVSRGFFLIGTGLLKKIAIADFLSVNLVDRVFANPDFYSATEVVLGLYAFTMQIYCDFSGYTDVARGSAMLMGFELPENFDRPYASKSPAEFWRRWHMTLSTWLRDYLYFPLGGSRSGPVRAYFNLGLTMFLIGVWHGASWTFVFYGLLQAGAMVLHRFFHRRAEARGITPDPRWLHVAKVLATLQFVVFSRILFRAENIENAGAVTARLWSGTWSVAQIDWSLALMLGLSFAAHYSPKGLFEGIRARFEALPAVGQGLALAAVLIGLRFIASSEVVPYIYYQF